MTVTMNPASEHVLANAACTGCRLACVPALLALLACCAPAARASTTAPAMASPLAPAILAGDGATPELWLAQRSIDREWGPSEDSTYRTIEVQDWKSEGLSMALSGVVPGTGQLYVGERSGWVFLLAEALAWTGRTITLDRGQTKSQDAAALVGNANDPAAPWSFERYSTNTGDDAPALHDLWDKDRESFYVLLARDSRYSAGFAASDPIAAYGDYRSVHESSQEGFRRSRYFEMALLLNHVVAAFDALRAARIHNLPLRKSVELQMTAKPSLHGGKFRAQLVTRF